MSVTSRLLPTSLRSTANKSHRGGATLPIIPKAMQANELMIGDWVDSYLDGHPIQLTAYDCYIIARGYNDGIEPIPLTAEILEKNGFELDDLRGTRYDIPGNDYYGISSYLDEDYNKCWTFCASGIFLFDIPFVHELQHALRLCELNDIADNFVI